MKNLSKNSIKNGKKGGRPLSSTITAISIPGINTVILTENQYNTLIEKYGVIILTTALKIFDNWLSTSPYGEKYAGKNNYAHFRADGWVINTAKELNS